MANTVGCASRYLEDNEWNDINTENTYMWNFVGLPNGNYVGVGSGDIYLSEDNGANWNVTESEWYESGVYAKEGVVYISGFSEVAISEDNGVNYTTYDREEIPDFWGNALFSDHTNVYYNADYELSTYDFINATNVSLQRTIDPDTYIDIETDWSGKGFYILEYENAAEEQMVITRYSSPVSSFDRIVIPITPTGARYSMETDHNGNVLMYNTDQIIISQDQGETWYDITPENDDLWLISDMTVSYDNYLYLATIGSGVLKYSCKLDSDIIDCDPLKPASTEDVSFLVYPNPFIDHVNLEMEDFDNFEVNIFDMKGLLIQNNKNTSRVELKSFSPGVYILEVSDLNSTRKIYEKIVK